MPYDPSLGPNLQCWLEDSFFYQDVGGTTPCMVDNQTIALWKDHSAGAHHFVAGIGPVYRSSSIHALPAARGNGVSYYLKNALLGQGWTDFTAFLVFQSAVTITPYERLLDMGYGNDLAICRNASSANQWGCFVLGQYASHFPTITLADGSPHILCVQRSGSTLTVYGDGETNHASDPACSTAALGTTALGLLGADNGGAGGSGTHADIAALVLRNSALAAGDRANDWNYLAAKYGITLSGVGGSASHPAHPSLFTVTPLTGVH